MLCFSPEAENPHGRKFSSPKPFDAAKKATPWHLLCLLVIKPSQQQAQAKELPGSLCSYGFFHAALGDVTWLRTPQCLRFYCQTWLVRLVQAA